MQLSQSAFSEWNWPIILCQKMKIRWDAFTTASNFRNEPSSSAIHVENFSQRIHYREQHLTKQCKWMFSYRYFTIWQKNLFTSYHYEKTFDITAPLYIHTAISRNTIFFRGKNTWKVKLPNMNRSHLQCSKISYPILLFWRRKSQHHSLEFSPNFLVPRSKIIMF